jgi:hypothetical protein
MNSIRLLKLPWAAALAPLALAAATLGWGAVAQAATTYDLNVDSCSSGCGYSDYGTITVTPSNGGDTLTVEVKLTSPNIFFNQAGNGFDAVGFDLVGDPTVTIAGLPSTFGANGSESFHSNHEDGLGDFGYVVDWVGPPTNNGSLTTNDLIFTITGTAPLVLGSTSSTHNSVSTNDFFEVDVAAITGKTTNTGVVGATLVGTVGAVPEPATWGLMIIGVGMAGGALRAARKSRRLSLVQAA